MTEIISPAVGSEAKALIVDDEKLSRKTLAFYLRQFGYSVLEAENGRQALQLWWDESPKIVLTDWNMPLMDGVELCRAIRESEGDSYTYLVMITSRGKSSDLIRGFESGVDDYLTKPVQKEELYVRLKSSQRIFALQDKDLVIFALAKLAETRDPETGYHLERIQNYSRALAETLAVGGCFAEINHHYIETIHATSPLHDIGKVGVPDRILLKPGKLNDEEFEVMKTHTTMGHETLLSAFRKNPKASYLRMSAEIARAHHERWDGSGYPDGLAGEDIPLAARIVAAADVYDALISRRVYKPPFSHERSRDVILEGRGTHFDPRVVDAFLASEERILDIARKYQE